MSLSMSGEAPASSRQVPASTSALDSILTAQIAVAWAGEGGEEPRLAWWRSDMASEFGGEDLFKRLLPHTWMWAVLQAVREAAAREDAKRRAADHNPDRLLSLYNLGFELDERIDERLQDLKRSGIPPLEALPRLQEILRPEWDQSLFADWLEAQGEADHVPSPVGRRLKGDAPTSPEQAVAHLVAGLLPLAADYPLPHYRTT